MSNVPGRLLLHWILRQSAPEPGAWLRARMDEAATLRHRDARGERAFDVAFGRIPRVLGRTGLAVSPADLAEADAARSGWDPAGWSVDEAARVLLLLCLPDSQDGSGFAAHFRRLRRTGDWAEQAALFRGLPLYRHSGFLEEEVGEGLRSNIRPVFEAIAHRNPYPRESFDQHRWNHMVLKALFVESRLAPIQGLQSRANAELALILRDYARERRAAGRPVSPELWSCLAPFADAADAAHDLARARAEDRLEEQGA